MDQTALFNADLIKRYDKAGPRYTSYPTAVQFHDGFGEKEYRAAAQRTNRESVLRPLSLYFHIPFCDTVCFYCGCNKVVTKRRERAVPYLEHLYREIKLQGDLFESRRVVNQLHWGGGTPTFISHDQMRELMDVTRRHFALHDDDEGEYSIELDPREVHGDTIAVLRDIGFNRISMGVQDFDPKVQKAVNRIQSEEKTLAVLADARGAGFKSVNLDLIYGLPFQTVDSFTETLEKIIAVEPDRLSVFNYAHLPDLFKPQRRINAEDLPAADEKLAILHMTISRLTDAGYVYIGMDHFAKPDDELAVAQRNRTLYRNFQGYSTHSDCDLVAMGNTSISMVGNTYGQNVKSLEEYYPLVAAGKLPIYRGITLSEDDVLRRDVITRLICHFELDKNAVAAAYDIEFGAYFSQELADLEQMERDGLVEVTPQHIIVLPPGRLLIRNVCMVFDRYLREAGQHRYSKVI
jgi:oxygen-independent coproporphyrinogen-3 oxidase